MVESESAVIGVPSDLQLTEDVRNADNDKYPKVKQVNESSTEQANVSSNVMISLHPEEIYVNVGETFIVSASVCTVEHDMDIFGWQVGLHFDSAVLECVNVSLPFDYVFSNAYSVGEALVEYNSTEFKNPVQSIVNDEGRMLVGDCLFGEDRTTLKEQRGLCQITFKAVSSGSSPLKLSAHQSYYETFVLDAPTLDPVTPVTNSSMVFIGYNE